MKSSGMTAPEAGAPIVKVTGDCARAGPAKRQPAQIKLRSSILIK
jgi:hypothetical protein